MKKGILIGLIVACVGIASILYLTNNKEDEPVVPGSEPSEIDNPLAVVETSLDGEETNPDAAYTLPYINNDATQIADFELYEGTFGNVYEFSEDNPEFLAVSTGEVVEAGWGNDGPGYYFIVADENSNYVTYSHIAMEAELPKEGDMVTKGDVISKAGNSGLINPDPGKVIVEILVNEGSLYGAPIDLNTLVK